mgnify:CR=1 FL=1
MGTIPGIDHSCFHMLRQYFMGTAGTVREYAAFYGLNGQRLKLAKPDCLVMHPGPINRGVEITPEVADGLQAVIEEQVHNGLAVRMALLAIMGGAAE